MKVVWAASKTACKLLGFTTGKSSVEVGELFMTFKGCYLSYMPPEPLPLKVTVAPVVLEICCR